MNHHLVINAAVIISKINLIQDQKVMLGEDLAELYDVETKRLNEQVKRNINRFVLKAQVTFIRLKTD
jgi:predicted XRE-type DNA-binding protein